MGGAARGRAGAAPARRWGSLFGLPLAWLAGVAVQLAQASLAAPEWATEVAAAALAGLGAAVFGWRRGRAGPALACALVAAAALGWASTEWRAALRLGERLPAALENRDLVVTGLVSELPREALTGPRFLFDIDAAALDGRPIGWRGTVSLGWFRGSDGDALLLGPATDVRAGQRWRFTVRLKRPHGALNPGGFDLELWMFERGIAATGSVRSRAGDNAELLAVNAGVPVERARQWVRDAIERHIDDRRAAGVLAALAIGDQAAIERDDWDLFRVTGVAHLMSISGLHVTMLAWLAAAAIGALWRFSERGMLLVPAQRVGRWGGLVVAIAYSVIAGWGVPAQRTVGMLALVVLLQGGARRWPLHLVLLVAGTGVVMADPWSLLQPGFWLSFAAVALLVAAEPQGSGREDPGDATTVSWPARGRHAALTALRTQAVATVGLAPLSLVFFQQVSLVGFGANLVAIPLVTLVITPLALAGVLLPWAWIPAAWCVQGLSALLQAMAAAPWAVWNAGAAPGWAMSAGLLGGALAVMPLPWRLRWLAVPLVLPLAWPAIPRPLDGEAEVVAADIGQGTAVLVRTRGHLLVYDTGPAYSAESDAGSRVLMPLLRHRGERRIDLLMVSHRDSDHSGGALSLLSGLPVAALSSSLEEGHPVLARGVPHRRCDAGQRWSWDGVEFEVLHPTAEEHQPGRKPNALSCVLGVRTATGTRVLLTGDIEAAQEAALVARLGPALASSVLLVPHHGSRTSSSAAFLEAVAPRLAVVQAGYLSRFGHPAPDVMARYAERGITVVRSDRCGAMTLPPRPDAASVCEREAARRYWHHPPAGSAE